MKKKIVYVSLIFVLFLSPFLVLSGHFLNLVDTVSLNYVISNIEVSVNSISSRLTSVLLDKYDVLKDIRSAKIDNKFLTDKIKEISKNNLVKKISYYDKDGNLKYSTDLKEKKKITDDYIFNNARKLDIPVGVISYPDNAPPELIMAEKIKDNVFIVVEDLGYLNEIVAKMSKKTMGKLYLIDGSYNLIFDSDYDYLFNTGVQINKDIVKLIDNLKSRGLFNYKGIIDVNGKKSIIALSNIETTNWWVCNIIDYSKSVNMDLKKWAKRVIFSGIVIILIFSYITLIIYEKLYLKKN